MTVRGEDVDSVISDLSVDERTVLRQIPRLAKSDTNVFSERQLKRKKPCHDLEIGKILLKLANRGLINPVKRRRWRTTSLGRKVGHELERIWLEERFGYSVQRG